MKIDGTELLKELQRRVGDGTFKIIMHSYEINPATNKGELQMNMLEPTEITFINGKIYMEVY